MHKLDDFSNWMNINSKLSDSSIYKYKRAIGTISNEMIERNVINKSLLEMSLLEMDISMINILHNEYFVRKNSTGNHMYSNALKQFRYYILEQTEDHKEEDAIEKTILDSQDLPETEKLLLINARKGQGNFRNNLIKKYNGKCIVTGIDKKKLLIASHIEPWAVSRNEERLDTENGLLLCANMDRLFDSGLITFDNNGKIKISSFVGLENEKRLHISADVVVDLMASNRLLEYLEYHRDILFVK